MNTPSGQSSADWGQTSSATPPTTKAPAWKVSPSDGKYYINSVAVSGDGRRVVGGTFFHNYSAPAERHAPPPTAATKTPASTATDTFGTYCYDENGLLLWKDEYAGFEGIYWVAVSYDGTRAASGGLISQTSPCGIVRAFDAGSGTSLLNYSTQQRVNQVALSRDGSWLVSAAETVVLFQYDVNSGGYLKAAEFTPTTSSRVAAGYANAVVSVGLSSDGRTIVFADYAGHLGVLSNDGGTLTLKTQWSLPASFCHMVALSSDGQWFAAGGAAGTFYLCQTSQFLTQGAPTYSYSTGVSGAVYGVAVEEDGSGFAGVVNVGEAGAVYFVQRDGDSVMLNCRFTTQRNPNSAALNVTQRLLAVADGHPDGTPGNFYLFQNIGRSLLPPPAPAGLRWQYQAGNMSWPIAISASGNAVVAGSDDSYLYYFTPDA